MPPKFGPAGNSESFYSQGYKSSLEAPEWLHNMGLDAYEYPCSRGVNIGEDKAKKLGEKAKKFNILLSIHAPYYINLSSQEDEKIQNSFKYIIDSVQAAVWMGAGRVVFHPGSCGKISRAVALNTTMTSLKELISILHDMHLEDITICPETMGKRNQLGTLDEVIEMCRLNEALIPTIDFGHINALGKGCLKASDDYRAIFESIRNGLGEYRLKNLHCHFSRIEYTDAGEKKHHRLCDVEYGPDFEPLAEVLAEYDIDPIIICESRGTMADDALQLKRIFEEHAKL